MAIDSPTYTTVVVHIALHWHKISQVLLLLFKVAIDRWYQLANRGLYSMNKGTPLLTALSLSSLAAVPLQLVIPRSPLVASFDNPVSHTGLNMSDNW